MSNQLLDDQFGEILDDSSKPQQLPLTEEEKKDRNLRIFSIVLWFLSIVVFIIIRIFYESTQEPPIDMASTTGILFRNSVYLSVWVLLNNAVWLLVKDANTFSPKTTLFLKIVVRSMIFSTYYFLTLLVSWFGQELVFPLTAAIIKPFFLLFNNNFDIYEIKLYSTDLSFFMVETFIIWANYKIHTMKTN